jgi:hypothetical protein
MQLRVLMELVHGSCPEYSERRSSTADSRTASRNRCQWTTLQHSRKPWNWSAWREYRRAHRTVLLPLPLRSWEQRQASGDVVAEVDRLFDEHTYSDIAAILNNDGMQSGEVKPLAARIVARIRRSFNLKPRYDQLRNAGLLTVEEMAKVLEINSQRVKIWNRHGLLRGHAYNAKNDCLYEHPGKNPP